MALHFTRLAHALTLVYPLVVNRWGAAAQGRQLLEAASRLLEESRGSLGAVQVAAAVSAAGLTAAMPDRTAITLPKLEVAISRSFELRPDETLQEEASTPRFARGAEPSEGGQPGVEPVQVRVRALAMSSYLSSVHVTSRRAFRTLRMLPAHPVLAQASRAIFFAEVLSKSDTR